MTRVPDLVLEKAKPIPTRTCHELGITHDPCGLRIIDQSRSIGNSFNDLYLNTSSGPHMIGYWESGL